MFCSTFALLLQKRTLLYICKNTLLCLCRNTLLNILQKKTLLNRTNTLCDTVLANYVLHAELCEKF